MNIPAMDRQRSVYRLLLARTAQILDRLAEEGLPPTTIEQNPKDG
jgi:hypothetical protein